MNEETETTGEAPAPPEVTCSGSVRLRPAAGNIPAAGDEEGTDGE